MQGTSTDARLSQARERSRGEMDATHSADKELTSGLVRQAFSKEHGRDPTEEEVERMMAAFQRGDPTDAHLGAVTAEEADACREIARISFKTVENREPTGNELSRGPIDILARRLRRAALEAVEPDIEAVRRELVRRAVEAEKASSEVVPFGPPPRPADEGAAESSRRPGKVDTTAGTPADYRNLMKPV